MGRQPKHANKAKVYSALEVATICGVVNQTAINWIKNGHLKAFTTPGGQFRVYPEDLVKFMQARNIRVTDELKELCGDLTFNKSIIIVDDDTGFNDVTAKYFGRIFEGTTIYQAYNGFEAGSIMAQYAPGVVVLDLDLPGIDGFELCKKIKEDKVYGKPIIIVVTALEEEGLEQRCKELGSVKFYKKPIDLTQLASCVKEYINS